MSATPRLKLPYIIAGQAQKEIAHNEALQIIDALCAPAVEQGPLDAPPASLVDGKTYIVGTAPTGAWAGKANQIANWSSGGWRFVIPPVGARLFVASTGTIAEYRPSGWEVGVVHADSVKIGATQVVGAQQAAIAAPSGGTTVDTAARTAIGQILVALRSHGLIAP